MDASALARLVGDPAGFLEDVWGRRPTHLPGRDPEGFAALLSLEDVDRILTATGLRAPAFRLVRDGRTLPQSEVTRRVRIGSRPVDDLVDVAAVHRAVGDGATLVLQGLHRSWPPVAALCGDLERTLTHPVQANAYLTPPVATGLRVHADPHDVLALQIHGRKRWLVHEDHDDGPVERWLEPGDVLYLPAGTRHAAQTVDAASLHLTIGIRPVRWHEVVRRAIEPLVDGAIEAQVPDAPLPVGWTEDPTALVPEVVRRIDAVRQGLVGASPDVGATGGGGGRAGGDLDALVADALTAEARRRLAARPPDLTGGLLDLLELDAVDDDTWLRRRPDVVLDVEVVEDRVELGLRDRRIVMPAALDPTVRRILAADRLRPADLDDLADPSSRLVLCRRLVREGVLAVDRAAGEDARRG